LLPSVPPPPPGPRVPEVVPPGPKREVALAVERRVPEAPFKGFEEIVPKPPDFLPLSVKGFIFPR